MRNNWKSKDKHARSVGRNKVNHIESIELLLEIHHFSGSVKVYIETPDGDMA